MQSRNYSLLAMLLSTAVACAYQNAGAGVDDPGDGDTGDGGSSMGGSAAQAGKTTLSTSGSTATPIAGTTGKGGTSAGGSGGKSSTGGKGGSGGKAGSGGKGGGTGGMEAAGGGDDGPINMPIAGLSVTFKADSTGDMVDFVGGELDVINDHAQPLTLADMKVRYYFTSEVTAPSVMMNWAQFGNTNNLGGATCTGQIVKLPKAVPEADSYVELTCSAASATDLAAGTLLKISWKAGAQGQGKFTQTGDYSLNDPSKIVVVNGNTIVWGVEPS
jgi:hypothetical protein